MTTGRGRAKTSTEQFGDEFWRGFERNRFEMRTGLVKVFAFHHRLAPSLVERVVRFGYKRTINGERNRYTVGAQPGTASSRSPGCDRGGDFVGVKSRRLGDLARPLSNALILARRVKQDPFVRVALKEHHRLSKFVCPQWPC